MSIAVKQNLDFSKDELSSPAQIVFYDYWQQLRAVSLMPTRASFNPMKIPSSLPYIIMVDIEREPTRFRARLMGSKCGTPNKYLGRVLNNDIPELQNDAEMFKKCIDTKSPYFYFDKITLNNGIVKQYSSLVLPFSADGEAVNIVMACHCPIE